jgi:hypothetical protein
MASDQPSPRKQVISAMNWMGGLALLLFWLPVVGPLIAGLVGGWKAGSVARAVAAVFLPAVLLFLMTFVGVTYLADAFWGFLAGAGAAAISLFNLGPLLLGALSGGLAAELRTWRRLKTAPNRPEISDGRRTGVDE